jgi:hypothetical protein
VSEESSELVKLERVALVRSAAKQFVPTEHEFKRLRTRLHPDKFQPDADMVAIATIKPIGIMGRGRTHADRTIEGGYVKGSTSDAFS